MLGRPGVPLGRIERELAVGMNFAAGRNGAARLPGVAIRARDPKSTLTAGRRSFRVAPECARCDTRIHPLVRPRRRPSGRYVCVAARSPRVNGGPQSSPSRSNLVAGTA